MSVSHGPHVGPAWKRPGAVWARTSRPSRFQVRYGLAPDALGTLSSGIDTQLEHDNTGWVMLTGLQSDTRYHYQLVVGGNDGPDGRFRTLPSESDYRHPVRNPRGLFDFSFEFGCSNWQPGTSRKKIAVPVFESILREHGEELHFAIQNGDWSYEVFRTYLPRQWGAQVGIAEADMPKLLQDVPQLSGAWEN